MPAPESSPGERLVSVAVPVRDGARYLREVLEAVRGQRIDAEVEVLVVDSGSGDGSVGIARAAGATVIEIPPSEFGHGRTRNLCMERARGEVVAFLTQDATPASEGWLAELVGGLDLDTDVGLAFGPHLPRADTSPMVGRELEEFFASKSPDAEPRVQREGDDAFFSNVNSAVRRECWEQVRFRDVPYAEDQAFARDALAAGWAKAYVPAAAVLHAHDYPWLHFMRRYFDEYRGLRSVLGVKEPLPGRGFARRLRGAVRSDLRWARRRGASAPSLARWAPRSLAHHAGRALFAPLGSRWEFFPGWTQRLLSLEGHAGAPPGRFGGEVRPPAAGLAEHFGGVIERRRGPAAPLEPVAEADARGPWRIAVLVPFWRRGSGGHSALFEILRGLERLGHGLSIRVLDPTGERPGMTSELARREVDEHFGGLAGEVRVGLGGIEGADIALATGWQTAHALWAVPGLKLRAYLIQDHEVEFYGTSAERLWAEDSYRLGYPCTCSSPWLRDVMRERYGARAEAFRYAVDRGTYRDLGVERDADTVVAYMRQFTPRRGTPLAQLALAELGRRRPRTRVVTFGDDRRAGFPFPHEHLGVVPPERLAAVYNRAAVGLVLSLTNHSLVPEEMMACGLPVVDLEGPASAVWRDGEAVLAEPDPLSIADAVEALLDDPERRAGQGERGRRSVAGRTWDDAAAEVERHLGTFMQERLPASRPLGAAPS